MIKHCSFDLWMTVIKSNPNFKPQLIALLSKELKQPHEYVELLLRNMKYYYIQLDEITGRHSDFIEQMHYLYSHCNIRLTKEELEEKSLIVYSKIEEIFLNDPPSLFDEYTKDVLQTLKDKEVTTNILSNTGIIQGRTLTKALNLLKADDLFNELIYSDECGYAKPNEEIFKKIYKYWDDDSFYKQNFLDNDIYEENILHIGDNIIADGGCVKCGMQYLQINSNSNNITKVLEYVK